MLHEWQGVLRDAYARPQSLDVSAASRLVGLVPVSLFHCTLGSSHGPAAAEDWAES